MIVECQKCGAPLSVTENQRVAQCAYCGTSSLVRSMRTTAQQTPPGWQPPAQWQAPAPPPPAQGYGPPPSYVPPPPVYYYQPRAPAPRNGATVIVGVIAAFMLMGVVGSFAAMGRSSFATRVNPSARPTYGTLALPGAPLARTAPGVAGGPIQGSRIMSGCRGYFPVSPQYTLRLGAAQEVRLTTVAGEDLTMAVRDPQGIWHCDDDGGSGNNPLLDLPFSAGTAQVWIGAYRRHARPGYTLDLRAGPPGAVPLAGSLPLGTVPTLGVVTLAGLASTQTRSGIAGGAVDASTLGSGCRGHIAEAPHLVLRTTDYRQVTLTTAATPDLTMVVADATGAMHCDDDSGGGMQPRLSITLPPGDHRVWIGTYQANTTGAFALTVGSASAVESTVSGGLAPSAAPTVGTLDLDRGPATTSLRGTVAGLLSAQDVAPSCRGYLVASPQLRLLTARPRRVTITASSSTDLTLLARGPRGDVVCADDSPGSSNPVLDVEIGAGETTVWVGSYARARRGFFRVQVTAQAPSLRSPVK